VNTLKLKKAIVLTVKDGINTIKSGYKEFMKDSILILIGVCPAFIFFMIWAISIRNIFSLLFLALSVLVGVPWLCFWNKVLEKYSGV